MWIEEAEELFKGYFAYYLFIVLPVFIIISPVNPVCAAYDFPVYRMQHYDLHGIAHGCRSASVNLEARSLHSWSTSRHCVVTHIQNLTINSFQNIRSKIGAILIILPENLSKLSTTENQQLITLEEEMLAHEISIPVYFVFWTPQLDKILSEISITASVDNKGKSAVEVLLSSISGNGYQIVINPSNPNPVQDINIATIQGNLAGISQDGKTPTIAIVAYYDAFGMAPDLSFGADSNGSGVVMLLEIMRLFSLLYSDSKTHGKYNIVFILSGGGKLNYQGSKKWLEDQLDSLDGSIIQDASYILCLDTLATNDEIYMHVSKPPKDGSPAAVYARELKLAAERRSFIFETVHKKINLADDLLAWEHERYSIRRLPAFTLSSLKNHKDLRRRTITDINENINLTRLTKTTHVVAEALANHIYNMSISELFEQSLEINESHLGAWIKYLSSQPRSAQLLCNKDNLIVAYLKSAFERYLRDVRINYVAPDKRDPDFMFYEVTAETVNIYSVKPAVFDLILTLAIVFYLTIAYFTIQFFPSFYITACNITFKRPKVH